MSRKHSTTTTRNFKHLTAYQRGEIQALLKEGLPKMRIAQKVGIVRSTLYEELKRGTVEQMNSDLTKRREYFADTGQLIYEEHRKVCRKPYKVDAASNFLRHIEKVVLEDKISPRCSLRQGETNFIQRFYRLSISACVSLDEVVHLPDAFYHVVGVGV
ncbi:helix-turn-helix domain-containing protein [uncultured Selenomonas sp.]|uniref:helix-turn-helix domain-containing protein n=1 Tax=uncultured Selenomonas sp. TaxID=159275 RepID=UPI0028D16C59|nr:helix-turn-helix domain-containing protein [uncultured Selenomonas sp.]